jgi:hypothetical protein
MRLAARQTTAADVGAVKVGFIANFKHVEVVPEAPVGRIRRVVRVHPQPAADIDQRRHRAPVGGDVVADALRVAEPTRRHEGIVRMALHGQHHRAPAGLDRGPHASVNLVVRVAVARRARVVLDVIDAPLRPLRRVDHLMVARRSEARTRVRPFRRVQPALQAKRMDVRSDGLEAVRELGGVGDLFAVC